MTELEMLRNILGSMKDPVIFVDHDHIIRYLNPAAAEKYRKRGHNGLVGKSIFDCHNARSKQTILEEYAAFQAGTDEIYLKVSKYNQKVFVCAVRDEAGNLVGYTERFEPNLAGPAPQGPAG
jgi:PAS domain-containing protein